MDMELPRILRLWRLSQTASLRPSVHDVVAPRIRARDNNVGIGSQVSLPIKGRRSFSLKPWRLDGGGFDKGIGHGIAYEFVFDSLACADICYFFEGNLAKECV
jgi:hypothetical protein